MDSAVDAMSTAYDDLIVAAAGYLEAQQASGGSRTPATEAALEGLKQRLDLLAASCDRAEAIVDSARRTVVAHYAAEAASPVCAAGAEEKLAASPCGGAGTDDGSSAESGLPAVSHGSAAEDVAK